MLYKIIPGNSRLKISDKGDIRPVSAKDKTEYTKLFTVKENNITLEMYGEMKTVELKWLSVIAHFGISLPKGFEKFIFRYRFRKGLRRSKNINDENNWTKYRYPFEVIFTEPVYYSKDFRIIPEFPDYAVSEEGEFISVKTGEVIKKNFHKVNDNTRYPSVSLYHRFFGKAQNKVAHVLVAITWIENDDYFLRSIVDHIDGDKNNCKANNLRWATYSENITYAYQGKQRTDNHPVKVYDSVKKTISIYHSVTEAFRSFKAKPRANLETLFKERNGYYIAKNRYEIRYLSDNNRFVLQDNTISSINKHLLSGVKRNRNYQAINTETKEEIIGSNGVLQKALGLSESGVTGICKKKTFFNNWIIRDYTTDPLNLEEYTKIKNTRIFIEATNAKTGTVKIFKSLREAGRYFVIDPITIKRIIRVNDSYRNVTFRYIKEDKII